MALTPREAFKIGFMMRCAEDGLGPAEVQDRIQKIAAALEKQAVLEPLSGKTVSSSLGGLDGLARLGLGTAVTVPIGLGLLGGYLLNRAREAEVDEEDVRTRELIDELKHWSRRARERQKAKMLRRALA